MAGIPVDALQPAYQEWSDVPPGERNYITSLVDQWNSLSGYTVQTPQWALMAMAMEGVNSLFMVGQFMWRHIYNGFDEGAYFVAPQHVMNSPWARYGIGADQFHASYTSYTQTLKELTGTTGDWSQFENMLVDQKGQMNASYVRGNILQDPNMLRTYGWLRYGIDYNQFQSQKQQWTHLFGHELSNDEGVQQLQYLHAAHTGGQEARARPTLTQEEKRKADVGMGDNVVR